MVVNPLKMDQKPNNPLKAVAHHTYCRARPKLSNFFINIHCRATMGMCVQVTGQQSNSRELTFLNWARQEKPIPKILTHNKSADPQQKCFIHNQSS